MENTKGIAQNYEGIFERVGVVIVDGVGAVDAVVAVFDN